MRPAMLFFIRASKFAACIDFFLQAEDGIRDAHVTGVQTCALPIFTIGADIETSEKSRKLARDLPENRLLTETDNPGGWKWLYGDTGFPVLIDTVEAELARVRDEIGRAACRDRIEGSGGGDHWRARE